MKENCTVTPKKKLATLSRAPPHTADSLHTRITVFRGFQRQPIDEGRNWSIFCRAARGGKIVSKNVSSVRLKMFTARFTPQPQRRKSSFLNNLVYCEQPQCRTIHTISQQCNSFLFNQAAQKNLWQGPAFHNFQLKPCLLKDFGLKHNSTLCRPTSVTVYTF